MTKKRYPRSAMEASLANDGQPAYIAYDPETQTYSSEESAKALASYDGFSRFQDYSNILPGISGRPGLTREGYNYYRPDEAMGGGKHGNVIKRCNTIYKEVGLIRNIIDLIGDFASKGIRLAHPNPRIEEWYNNWFLKVNGPERSERLSNYLVRTANVVIKRQTAKIPVRTEERLYKTHSSPDISGDEVKESEISVSKREIPWKYTFIDASVVEAIGGPLAAFVGKPMYGIKLPTDLKRRINSPKNQAERDLVAQLPADIVRAAKQNDIYLLPADKTIVIHYKKDDWDTWACPIIFSIFKDIVAYDKLKLADISALDGAISHVRIFKLGNLQSTPPLMPTKAAANRLAEILQSGMGGGTMDIIWGPDIELVESKSEVYKFLGEDKYKPILNAIYAGLGIPPTLTGTFGAAGTTNNFISLKTLTERLGYIRELLVKFWSNEIMLVQKAMGFRFPATVEFDLMDLGNEDAIRALYKELSDRNIISDETMQRIFKQDPKMEKTRINREEKARKNKRMARKTGPFVEPESTESLKKIALQTGVVGPSQVGLELEEPKEGDKTLMDIKTEQLKMAGDQKIAQQKNTKGASGQGRPKGASDSTKRKTKTFTPRSRAVFEIWASKAQGAISEILTPIILQSYGKKNQRQLTTAETEQAEKVKFGVLSHIDPMVEITNEVVKSALDSGPPIREMANLYRQDLAILSSDTEQQVTLDDMRKLQIAAYIDFYLGANNE